jgi:hypothetical protein
MVLGRFENNLHKYLHSNFFPAKFFFCTVQFQYFQLFGKNCASGNPKILTFAELIFVAR